MILEDILIKAGVDYKEQRDELIMPCPFCSGQHDTAGSRRVFGINLNTGYAHCYRCDWGSKSLVYTARTLCELFQIPFDWQLRMSAGAIDAEEKKSEPPKPTGLPEEYEYFIGADDAIERKARRYLRERMIGRDLIQRYHIGYAGAGKFSWRIIIPVVGEDGLVYGCVGRDFSGKSDKKYLNTTGNTKIMWGMDVATKETKMGVVQEGIIDSLRSNMRLAPLYQNKVIAVSCLGSTVTNVQLAQLSRFETVTNFPDFDRAGVEGMVKRAEAMDAAGLRTMVVVPDELTGEDPDSMPEEKYIRHLRAAMPWGGPARIKLKFLLLRSRL